MLAGAPQLVRDPARVIRHTATRAAPQQDQQAHVAPECCVIEMTSVGEERISEQRKRWKFGHENPPKVRARFRSHAEVARHHGAASVSY